MVATSTLALVAVLILGGVTAVCFGASVKRALGWFVDILRRFAEGRHRKKLRKEELRQLRLKTAILEEQKRNEELWAPGRK